MSNIDIDVLYDTFCSDLPEDTRDAGRSLPVRLGLAPRSDIPWSRVFKHEVTLHAPLLVAEGMRDVEGRSLERAVLGHMLSVIEAFGTDRVADRQATDTPELRRLLACMRSARDEALVATGGAHFRDVAREADRRTGDAISRERDAMATGEGLEMSSYSEISTDKQAVGLPASIALATSAGWTEGQMEVLRATLMGVWLGLQFQDDVYDWQEDAERGGAWVVLLAQSSLCSRAPGDPVALRRWIDSSGVPAQMLALAEAHFRAACDGATRLGATRLARWASACALSASEQGEGERRSPGYVRRFRALSAFRAEVVG